MKRTILLALLLMLTSLAANADQYICTKGNVRATVSADSIADAIAKLPGSGWACKEK